MRKWKLNISLWMDGEVFFLLTPASSLRPSKTITQLAWRPLRASSETNGRGESSAAEPVLELAVASEDRSLRLFGVSM